MTLNTSRISDSVRLNAFALHKRTASEIDGANRFVSAYTKPILRKSFRKTLRTVEGVRVRMKNCFVPYVPASAAIGRPKQGGDADDDESDDEAAALEESAAGSEERTVVLSVEIENADPAMGFVVEEVQLTISGGLAHASLIGWGESIDANVFPLTLKGSDQYNLLYRVSFLTLPEGNTANDRKDPSALAQKRQSMLSAASAETTAESMRRYVAIDLKGHPFRPIAPKTKTKGAKVNEESPDEAEKEAHFDPYSSRWNCLLDLLTTQQADPPTFYNRPSSPISAQDVMPTPASPFPASTSRTALGSNAIASPTTPVAPWNILKGPSKVSSPASGSMLSPLNPQAKFTPSSPSEVIAAMNAQTQAQLGTPTPRSDRFSSSIFNTANIRSSFLGSPGSSNAPSFATSSGDTQHPKSMSVPVPPTPAFPSYPSDATPGPSESPSVGPTFQAPLTRGGYVGIDPNTQSEAVGNMIVTINLLPPKSAPSTTLEKRISSTGNPIIYPHDVFSLDIFVLNLSEQIRRCEIGYPTQKRRRARTSVGLGLGTAAEDVVVNGSGYVNDGQVQLGLMPLENRIRVGPLLPGACQSVQMQILALSPGVHMIDAMTLTDVATSYTVNMRSVMTVVISEPEITP
ncbi:hypothetical protein DL93DRAFT_2083839 [Clavulina sp. PMI_390]|nr:hypothetical protein DL93DRAFT_2083839 [Clavulina sp. PMI_390]